MSPGDRFQRDSLGPAETNPIRTSSGHLSTIRRKGIRDGVVVDQVVGVAPAETVAEKLDALVAGA